MRFPLPREHGAWFMLGYSCLIGASVSGAPGAAPVWLVVAAAFLTFIAMEGAKQLRRQRSLQSGRLPLTSTLLLSVAAVLGALVVLLWNHRVLLVWGAVSLLFVVLHALAVLRKRERTALGEWVGILGLTAAAPAVWSAGSGQLTEEPFLLWLLCFLYFGGTVPYVKLRVRQMKGHSQSRFDALGALSFAAMGLVVASLVTALRSLNPILLVPFLLALLKTLAAAERNKPPRSLARVGIAEIGFSTIFAGATIVTFLAPPSLSSAGRELAPEALRTRSAGVMSYGRGGLQRLQREPPAQPKGA